MQQNSLAQKYSKQAHQLYKGYADLLADPNTGHQVRAQAQNGMDALKSVLQKVQGAAVDLSSTDQLTRDFYHTVTLPLLDGQISAMQAHLSFLQNPSRALHKAMGAFTSMGNQGQGRDYSPSEGWKQALHSTMGVWSLNPNKWGMTPEEANAYDVAKAQAAADEAQANPGFFDSISQSAKMLAFAGTAYFGFKIFFAPKGKNSSKA